MNEVRAWGIDGMIVSGRPEHSGKSLFKCHHVHQISPHGVLQNTIRASAASGRRVPHEPWPDRYVFCVNTN